MYTLQFIENDGVIPERTAVDITVVDVPPSQSIHNPVAYVHALGLPQGIDNSLTQAKLENAQRSLAKGNPTAAVNQLNAFIHEVEARAGKKITEAQAAEENGQATREFVRNYKDPCRPWHEARVPSGGNGTAIARSREMDPWDQEEAERFNWTSHGTKSKSPLTPPLRTR